MNHLNKLIDTFTTEERLSFINFLEKKNKRTDTKNIQLFKLLATNHTNTKEICFLLYKKENSAAYHALRKRLYQSIIDFIANINLEKVNTTELQTIKYLIAARNFMFQKQFYIAFKILDKAEKLAKEHFLFSLLNEIYHTQIQYAYATPTIDIDILVAKFDQNMKSLLAEEQLNIVYAKVRNAINKIRFEGKTINITSFFFQTLEEHHITISESLTFKSLYQLISIGSLTASLTKNYNDIELFLEDTYQKIKCHQHKQKQLYYHIQILYHLANMYFRNKKFKKSLHYLNLMEIQMKERHKKYESLFKIKHQNLVALCYNYSGEIDTAIAIAEQNIKKNHPDKDAFLHLQLSLAMYYFQKNIIKNALHLFSKFNHQDKWYEEKAGKEWTIKKNIIEILLHIEENNIDFVESRLLSFKRKYFPYLKESGLDRVITFISLVEELFKNPETLTSLAFKEKVENSFVFLSNIQEDIFVMSFYAWLKAKINGTNLYDTTLEMTQRISIKND
ncbi:MAG: hypothetical protein V3U92_13500 [Cellulophaga sp.]